ARRERRLLDGLPLDFRNPARDAEDDLRERQPTASTLADEVAQHLLGHLKVCDHAVSERPDRPDRGRRPPNHPACVTADRLTLAGPVVDGNDRGLEDDDSLATDEDERIRGAEIDRELPPAE